MAREPKYSLPYNQMTLDNLTAKVITNIEDLNTIRNDWKNERFHDLMEYELYITMVTASKRVISPFVIVVKKNEIPEAIIAAQIEKIDSNIKIVSNLLAYANIRSLTILELGVGGCDSEECSFLVMEILLQCLRKKEADLLQFKKVKYDFALYQLGRKMAGPIKDYFPKTFKRYFLSKNKPYKELLSKKRWKELNRNRRRLHEQFPNGVEMQCFTKTEDVALCCQHMEEISKESKYRNFTNNSEIRQNMECLAALGNLKIFMLFVNKMPRAYYCGFIQRGAFVFISTAYDLQYSKFRIGSLLMWHVLECLWTDENINVIDYGSGQFFYKELICDISWDEASFYIFQPSFKGFLINCVGTIFRFGSKILKYYPFS